MANDLILVVDADEKSQRVLKRCLQRAGYALQLTRTSQEALAWLDANDGEDPSLIICGTELPGASGFDFCAQVKAKLDWEPIPFLFLADVDDPDLRQRAFDLGVEDVLIRPVYVKEITTRIQLLLQRREQALLAAQTADEVQGDLSDTPVLDVLQTLEDQSQTGTFEFERNGRRGVIYARQGRILDASVGNLRGADAVFRLMQWSDGAYTFTPLPALQRPDRVQTPTSDLLIEGMQRLDQWDDLTDSGHALDRVHEVNYKLLADHLRNIPEEVNGIIRLFDGYRTVQDVIDDSALEGVRTLQVVQKLIDQGLIYDVTPTQDAATGQAAAADPLTDWLDMEVGETTGGTGSGKRGQAESEADKVRRRREERKRRKLDSKRRRTQRPDAPKRRASQRIASRPLPEPIPALISDTVDPAPAAPAPAPAPEPEPMSELEQLQAQLALIEAQTQSLQDQKEQLRDEVQAEAQAEAQAQAELEQLAQERAEEQARIARERERAEREAEALRQRIAQAQQLAAQLAAERAQLSEQLAQQRQRTRQTSKALEDLEHGAPIDPNFLPSTSVSALTSAKAEAERKAKEDAERKAQEAAAKAAKQEAERQAKAEAERKAQEEAERKAKEDAEKAAQAEAERKAQEDAEREALAAAEREAQEARERAERAEREALALVAAREAEAAAARKAQEEAERRIREETERRVREEIERRLREEAERKANEEAERKAKEAAEQAAKEEAERKAKEEVERKAQEEAERKAKEDAEKAAQEEAERKAKEAAELAAAEAAKEEAERKAKEEAERKAKEDAEAQAKAEAERKAQEEADKAAKEEENKAKAAAVSALSQAAKNFKPPQERTRTRDLSKEKASVAATPSPDAEARESKDPDPPAPAPAPEPAAKAEDKDDTDDTKDVAAAAPAPAPESSPEDDFFKDDGAEASFWSDADQDNLYPAEGPDNTPKIVGALILIAIVGLIGYVVYTKDKGAGPTADTSGDKGTNGAKVADADAGAKDNDAGAATAEADAGAAAAPVATSAPLSDTEAPKRAEELAQTRLIKPTRELANLIDGRDPVTGEPLVPVDTQAEGDGTSDEAGTGDDEAKKSDDDAKKDEPKKDDAKTDAAAKTDTKEPAKKDPPKKDGTKTDNAVAKTNPKGPGKKDPVVTPAGPDPAMAAMNDQAKKREARNAINKAKRLLRSNPDGAIQELNKAATLAPGSPQINLMLGQAYRAKRSYTQAINYFERALRANPNNLAAIEMLATSYMAAGQRSKAFALYRKYLQLRPTGPQSERIRKILIANGQAVN